MALITLTRDGVIQETLRYFKEKPPQLGNWMQMLVSGGSREPDGPALGLRARSQIVYLKM